MWKVVQGGKVYMHCETKADASNEAQALANRTGKAVQIKPSTAVSPAASARHRVQGPKITVNRRRPVPSEEDSVFFITSTDSRFGKVRMVETGSRASALAWIKQSKHMHPHSSKYVITKGTRAQWERTYGNQD